MPRAGRLLAAAAAALLVALLSPIPTGAVTVCLVPTPGTKHVVGCDAGSPRGVAQAGTLTGLDVDIFR